MEQSQQTEQRQKVNETKLCKGISYNQKLKEFPPRFNFDGQIRYIDQFLFYDGDTFCGVMQVEDKPYTFVFRCLGYDSIEKKIPKKDLENIPPEDIVFLKQMYDKSYNLLQSLVEGKQLKVQCSKSDLYQRILVNIFVKSDPNSNEYDICVNDELLKSNLVFKYDESNLTKKTLKEQISFLKQYHQLC